jgi:ubiquinone/menaquinone biosynthesis C-methylase UbiE
MQTVTSEMDKSGFTSDADKIGQEKDWDSVAAGWKKWWKIFENGGQKVSDKLVELAGIKTGQRVLDIATGIGEPAITACRKLGDSGYVLATDISSEMLAIGRMRAQHEGLNNIEFKEGDAATLDLPSSTFDAALCRWGLMFLPNLSTVLKNIQRSLVSGGKFATAVWAEPAKVPQLNIAMSIVKQYLQLPLPNAETQGPFSLADLTKLKKFLLQADFKDIKAENVQVNFEFGSAEDYVSFTQDIAAPVNMMLANETAERKSEIWNLITDKVKSQYMKDGRVALDNECICVVANRQ